MDTKRRLIIVGNGLDLALGLRTSYKDFIAHLYKSYLLKGFARDIDEPLIKIQDAFYDNTPEFVNGLTNDDVELDQLRSYLNQQSLRQFKSKLQSRGLFKLILDKTEMSNWVDIERLYFNELVRLHNVIIGKDSPSSMKYSEIDRHNNEFKILIDELINYLEKIDSSINPLNIIRTHGDFMDILINYWWFDSPGPTSFEKDICFLNFNYTSSLHKLLEPMGLQDRIIPIHGTLSSKNQAIIFGYGDDTNDKYKDFENDDHDECLKYIKSFQYSLSDRYQKMLSYINGGDYEVFIIGHSCGMSDKTLFQTIFEHSYCKKIRVFHQNSSDEFFWKTMAISRHFNNKTAFRDKLIPFDQSCTIPQA
jgi:hypothetical protein